MREKFYLIAGPCAVESEKQILEISKFLKDKGIKYLRGGSFKHRTNPDAFQGLGKEGIKFLMKAKERTGMKIVSEILDVRDIRLFKDVDIIQIGARNSQNFPLIKEVAKTSKIILLKRGFGNTIDEWISTSKYIVKEGNKNIIMCCRGIRTFENGMRNSADIDAIPIVKKKTGFPVVFDPSHSAGRKDLVVPLSKAAIAIGCDGLLIEVHNKPEEALSDNKQQLNFEEFEELLEEIKPYLELSGLI